MGSSRVLRSRSIDEGNSSFNNNTIHWVIGSVGAANLLVIDYCLGAGSNEKETRLPCSRPEDLPFYVFLLPFSLVRVRGTE